MSSHTWRCQSCQKTLQGRAEFCVACYARAHAPCPRCMEQHVGGKWSVRRKPRGKGDIDCAHCNNERWILDMAKLRHYVRGPTAVDK